MAKFRLLIASFCLICLCAAAPAQAAKYALLIGISDYSGSGLSNLDGTLNDVELVRTVLVERFEFPVKNIRVLKNAEATHTGLRAAFSELVQKVGKDDVVYIHYAGHGSLTPDLTGEKKASYLGGPAYASTWVSYGSRIQPADAKVGRDGLPDLNPYDVLGDEVEEWLIPLYDKTDNVVFVSDSCHSGSLTRGEAPKVRAAPVDLREHPLARRKLPKSTKAGVMIGAARKDQEAGEYRAPDGKSYGLFTWNWVQALYLTQKGDSWEDAFKRTAGLIGNVRETRQNPVLDGNRRREVFGGEFRPLVPSVSVTEVSGDGTQVVLKAGSFVGVTEGSTYRRKGGSDLLEVVSVEPFSSVAEVKQGRFKKGDLAVEEQHAYPYTPLKIFVKADLPQDKPLSEAIGKAVAQIPGYQVVDQQRDSQMMLMVLRPLRDGKGVAVKKDPRDTLPAADPAARPEVLVLTPDELPIRENMIMQPESETRAIELVKENLKKLSRIRELKKIGGSDGAPSPLVELTVNRYTRDAKCQGGMPACLTVPQKGKYRLVEAVAALKFQDASVAKGDVLTFRIKNNSTANLYCYLIDISASGAISAIFPGPLDRNEAVLVPAGKEQDFGNLAGLEIEEAGEDTVKLIVSQMPIDVTLFEQSGYATRAGVRQGIRNPLENFLTSSMGNMTRGSFSMSVEQWGALSVSFLGK